MIDLDTRYKEQLTRLAHRHLSHLPAYFTLDSTLITPRFFSIISFLFALARNTASLVPKGAETASD